MACILHFAYKFICVFKFSHVKISKVCNGNQTKLQNIAFEGRKFFSLMLR